MAKDKQDKEFKKDRRKGFFKGFKDFLTRGNVIDMAVGIVIGAAFGAIINAIVSNLIMPPIALLFGNYPFEQLTWILRQTPILAADGTQAVDANGVLLYNVIQIQYGLIIQSIVQFIIIAFCIYAIITLVVRRKQFNDKIKAEEAAKLAAETPPVAPEVPADIQLLTEIRDFLNKTEKE
jgi:large conductance mechanosensitive channel